MFSSAFFRGHTFSRVYFLANLFPICAICLLFCLRVMMQFVFDLNFHDSRQRLTVKIVSLMLFSAGSVILNMWLLRLLFDATPTNRLDELHPKFRKHAKEVLRFVSWVMCQRKKQPNSPLRPSIVFYWFFLALILCPLISGWIFFFRDGCNSCFVGSPHVCPAESPMLVHCEFLFRLCLIFFLLLLQYFVIWLSIVYRPVHYPPLDSITDPDSDPLRLQACRAGLGTFWEVIADDRNWHGCNLRCPVCRHGRGYYLRRCCCHPLAARLRLHLSRPLLVICAGHCAVNAVVFMVHPLLSLAVLLLYLALGFLALPW